MPLPAKRVRSCTLETLSTGSKSSATSGGRTAGKKVSLFEQKRLRGFWPCVAESNGQHILAVSRQTILVLILLLLPKFIDYCGILLAKLRKADYRERIVAKVYLFNFFVCVDKTTTNVCCDVLF